MFKRLEKTFEVVFGFLTDDIIRWPRWFRRFYMVTWPASFPARFLLGAALALVAIPYLLTKNLIENTETQLRIIKVIWNH